VIGRMVTEVPSFQEGNWCRILAGGVGGCRSDTDELLKAGDRDDPRADLTEACDPWWSRGLFRG